MLTYIKINGFKSFHDFEMDFSPFTVIAGTNASGKSNLFDALKLLSRLAESDSLKKAFKEQRGEFLELFTQYSEDVCAREISFVVEMLVNKDIKDAWGNIKELKYTRLRYELNIKRFTNTLGIEDLFVSNERLVNLKHDDDTWILQRLPKDRLTGWRPLVKGRRAIPYMETTEENGIPTVLVPQDGTAGNKRRFPLHNATRTVLSSFDTIDFPHVLAAKEEMRSWKFLELNPEDLRQPTSKNTGEDRLSQSGKNLAAVLYRMKQEDPYILRGISRRLQTFLPNFTDVDVIDDVENKQYLIKLKDKDKKEYSSRVLSEGTLRILTLCILENDNKHTGLLCFEEPENGIHPRRISDIADLLKGLSVDFFNSPDVSLHQIIVNTHSTVLVNCIHQLKLNPNVSLWYASIVNRTTDIENKRIHLNVTRIIPVEISRHTSLKFSDQEIKITLAEVNQFLETNSSLS
jgi:predicted ATPase